MKNLKVNCNNIMYLIQQNYPNQINYVGAVRKIYELANGLLKITDEKKLNKQDVNINNLIREFVDETTHYSSPIIRELEIIEEILNK